MASSSIGFIDLPYASMPFDVDGSAINTGFIAASDSFEHDILFISGAKNENDVMRGEETQLIGCIAPGQWVKNELFIFPGTHSKHITVKENQAIDLRTYMTGELFSLLATQSILKNTVQPGDFYPGAFKRGLIEAAHRNMLNLIFKVRTNGLFDVCTGSENYHYLSGLLIGTELKDLSLSNAETVNLVCGNDLLTQYQLALSELAPDKKLNIFSVEQGDAATVVGQLTIAKHLKILK
jgi:2-dehydro-3-deoxygalactonokinase